VLNQGKLTVHAAAGFTLNLSIGEGFSRIERNPWHAADPSAPGEK